MAVWQICFSLIDSNKTKNSDDIVYWDNEPNNVYDISFLPLAESYSNDIIQYGDLQNTCIELLKENNKVIEISVRLDLREINENQIKSIINYINKIKARIYYQDDIISPTPDDVYRIIKQSSAYSFCNNPTKFIYDLK